MTMNIEPYTADVFMLSMLVVVKHEI